MVNIINNSVCRGVAGRRVGDVKGVVIHNTWTTHDCRTRNESFSRNDR